MSEFDIALLYILIGVGAFALVGGTMAFMFWRATRRQNAIRDKESREREERRRDEDLARAQEAAQQMHEFEERRIQMERSRISAEYDLSSRVARTERDRVVATNSGAGSGGYVLIDVPDADRSLFHDLAKGFEDYARLKGYSVSFSIDNSWEGRAAYKFTVLGQGVVVGSEQVRKDFKDYAERVRHDDDDFEDMPVITNMAEHNLMVTMLKNRVVFFRANYKAYKNTVTFLEKLIASDQLFPALPQPSVIIHNGVNMDSRNYNASNSSRLIQGDSNTYTDSSINIGRSFNERQERIAALDDVIAKLNAIEGKDEALTKAELNLAKVRDELADDPQPNESAIRRWMEGAKNAMTAGILGYETVEAARKLWELFGI
jgi:hypothetical protein